MNRRELVIMSLVNDASSSHDGGSNGESVVDDRGRYRSTCGYCKSPARSSIAHGLSAETLTVYDYQGSANHLLKTWCESDHRQRNRKIKGFRICDICNNRRWICLKFHHFSKSVYPQLFCVFTETSNDVKNNKRRL